MTDACLAKGRRGRGHVTKPGPLGGASLPRSAPPGYIPASRKMGPDSTTSPCPALPCPEMAFFTKKHMETIGTIRKTPRSP